MRATRTLVRRVEASDRDVTPTSIAWAAGFWDGEGCVVLDLRSMHPALHISQSGDEAVEILVRFALSVGVAGRIYKGWRKSPEHKPAFKLHIVGTESIRAFDLCRVYLTNTKIAQATRAFDAWAERKKNYVHHNTRKTHCVRGHEFSPENTRVTGGKQAGRRRCKACRHLAYISSKGLPDRGATA